MAVTMSEQASPRSSPMRMGISLFVASEAFLFGALFWTYYYLRGLTPGWPPEHPAAGLAAANTVLLVSSSVAVWLAGRAIRKRNERGLYAGLLVTAVLGAAFLGITGWEWVHEDFRPWTNAYGSTFYTLTGFHALHVFGGVVLMLALLTRTARHLFSADNFTAVQVGSIYWHFVDVVWLAVFTTIFIIR
jgi:cytochrome c oxidase subunit I+III